MAEPEPSVVQRNVKIRNCLEGQTNFSINPEGMARRKLFAYLNLRAPVVGALELRDCQFYIGRPNVRIISFRA